MLQTYELKTRFGQVLARKTVSDFASTSMVKFTVVEAGVTAQICLDATSGSIQPVQVVSGDYVIVDVSPLWTIPKLKAEIRRESL